MGNYLKKQNSPQPANNIVYVDSTNNIKEIILKYEYIKHTKNITDANKVADIIRNTDWDKNQYQDVVPSAPPIIAYAQPIFEPGLYDK